MAALVSAVQFAPLVLVEPMLSPRAQLEQKVEQPDASGWRESRTDATRATQSTDPTDPTDPTNIEVSPTFASLARTHEDIWTAVGALVQANRRVRILLVDMRLEAIDTLPSGTIVTLYVVPALLGTARACERDLADAFAMVLRTKPKIHIVTDAPKEAVKDDPAQPSAPAAPVRPLITDHPLIKAATELFGAKLIAVQPRRTIT